MKIIEYFKLLKTIFVTYLSQVVKGPMGRKAFENIMKKDKILVTFISPFLAHLSKTYSMEAFRIILGPLSVMGHQQFFKLHLLLNHGLISTKFDRNITWEVLFKIVRRIRFHWKLVAMATTWNYLRNL